MILQVQVGIVMCLIESIPEVSIIKKRIISFEKYKSYFTKRSKRLSSKNSKIESLIQKKLTNVRESCTMKPKNRREFKGR